MTILGAGVGALIGRRVALALLSAVISVIADKMGMSVEVIWTMLAGPIAGIIGISAEDVAKARGKL